ncbi:MAG: DUF481 domain-containing protein [Gemmatimonadota bacterium]|jgi:putative salt-induced outer membrane protein YdiY
MRLSTRSWTGIVLVAVATITPAPGAAQDTVSWKSSTELSYVSTGGNSSSSTLGLKATLTRTSGPNAFKVEAGGIRSETGFTTRTATGTETDYSVSETTVSRTTAESSYLRGRYDRTFARSFAFVGAGWDRNTFSGIRNRYAAVVGVGRTLVDGESGHLKADIGTTYTVQKDVDPTPGAPTGFGGLRVNVDAARNLTSTTELSSVLVVDESLKDTQDLRADWTNSVSVALSQRLALKTSLQLLFDNVPALLGVPLVDANGQDTGLTVTTPSDKLDRIMTLTLVIKL